MKERPIIFSGQRVRAILDGRKTQTRRLVKADVFGTYDGGCPYGPNGEEVVCPYGSPRDRLWVRETWYFGCKERRGSDGAPCACIAYAESPKTRVCWLTDAQFASCRFAEAPAGEKWAEQRKIPSIYMPRWASRITLEVVNIRVERLQEVSEDDAIAEGVYYQKWPGQPPDDFDPDLAPLNLFRDLWRSIHGPESWEKNPWVWVVEFKRIES